MVNWDLKQSDIEVLGFHLPKKKTKNKKQKKNKTKKQKKKNLTSNMAVERVPQMKTMEKY